ncbi:hypothetical protein GF356_01145 [candidate division GN15 bacterium]|nr:hypothetical protein [candidate division GN15 bacterium]
MTEEHNSDRQDDLELVEQVDALNEEVKGLALNLAIYLAKAKASSEEINRMEPEFIQLVNGTVKAVQELGTLINAARSQETMIFDIPSGKARPDRIETKLRLILDQCAKIMASLGEKFEPRHMM